MLAKAFFSVLSIGLLVGLAGLTGPSGEEAGRAACVCCGEACQCRDCRCEENRCACLDGGDCQCDNQCCANCCDVRRS